MYDVIPLEFPRTQTLAQRLYWQIQLPLAARTAQHIVTISEASKRSIVERLSVPPRRVTVTLPGIDASFAPPTDAHVTMLRERLRIPKPYLLTVGTIEPRKNIDKLVRGFARVARRIPHTLVIAGRFGWKTDAVRRALADPRLHGRVVLLGTVEPADLPVLYGGADAFAFLSRAEGFGFPPLEAMACGTPVVCSAAGSLGEVVGNAAMFVNPDDERAVTEGLERIVSDAALRERLRRAGITHSATFTWRRTAEETLQVYATVVRNAESR
jgi:glycosyltransferase involved in cell wall biosynthesis